MSNPHLATRRSDPVGYSSNVRLDLIVDGRTVPLAKMSHDRVVLVEATGLATGLAAMVLYVDGKPRRWEIEILPHEPGEVRIPIRRIS